MAYAMTRPTIIVTSTLINSVKYFLWHYFSEFSNIFKISKKLISFNYKEKNLFKKIMKKKDESKYFNEVTAEIKKNVF